MTDRTVRVALVTAGPPDGRERPLTHLLARAGCAVADGPADVVLLLAPDGVPREVEDAVLARAQAGTPVLAVGPRPSQALADTAGPVPGRLLPVHAVRVRPGRDAGDLTDRVGGDELLLNDRWSLVDKVADDVEQLLTASSALTDHAVATWRPATRVATLTVGSTPGTDDDAAFARIVVRLLRRVVGLSDGPPVRIGMRGCGAIGNEHAVAVARTQGLELAAACDPNSARIQAARAFAPDARDHAVGEALLADDDVDLVVVSTPPNTHADRALRALQAGKHVVVEKPFCLTVEEADRQTAAAADAGLTLAVHQNRRWDVDCLAVRAAVRSGRLGEVFHLETFVGGYDHPCNFWHSGAGGVGLGHRAQARLARRHQRRPHARAAAPPGRRRGGVHALGPGGVLRPRHPRRSAGGVAAGAGRQPLAGRAGAGGPLRVSDAPSALSLLDADGSRTELALPAAPAQPFHRELADALLSGLPMSVTPQGSRRNVAVLQAATQSAAEAGRPVALPA